MLAALEAYRLEDHDGGGVLAARKSAEVTCIPGGRASLKRSGKSSWPVDLQAELSWDRGLAASSSDGERQIATIIRETKWSCMNNKGVSC